MLITIVASSWLFILLYQWWTVTQTDWRGRLLSLELSRIIFFSAVCWVYAARYGSHVADQTNTMLKMQVMLDPCPVWRHELWQICPTISENICPEDGGGKYFRNFGTYDLNCTASHPGIQLSLWSPPGEYVTEKKPGFNESWKVTWMAMRLLDFKKGF